MKALSAFHIIPDKQSQTMREPIQYCASLRDDLAEQIKPNSFLDYRENAQVNKDSIIQKALSPAKSGELDKSLNED